MDIDLETVRRLFNYNKETGHLTWRCRPREYFPTEKSYVWHNKMYAGKRAGSEKTDHSGHKFRRVCVFYKVIPEHSLVWFYVTGSWPSDQIDHLDQDATNNAWDNLRESNALSNMKNRPMQSNNKSGVTGVSWSNQRGKWIARVGVGYKVHYIGSFGYEDLDIAAMAVMEFYAENGFTFNHGKESSISRP